jgi:DNA-directed RNA polymerase specialized sigma24 family protein
MMEWISVKDALPPRYEAVLTQHIDDLYPVAAYRVHDRIYAKEVEADIWLRLIEGPEDVMIVGSHVQLYRNPTHWMPLPEPPKEE